MTTLRVWIDLDSENELDEEFLREVDLTEEDVSEFISGAIIIRLHMENDREYLEKATAERAEN